MSGYRLNDDILIQMKFDHIQNLQVLRVDEGLRKQMDVTGMYM